MKFTLNWLKEHLEGDYTLTDVVLALTSLGLEVENVKDPAANLGQFRVGHILNTQKHPDADRLKICTVQVDLSQPPLQVVCGAPNARENLKVIFASPGVIIPSTGKELKTGLIRGVESQGMLCSGAELLLDQDANGIMELPEDSRVGDPIGDILGLNDPVIDIAITPNRGDCLGIRGIARDLAAKGIGTLKPLPQTSLVASPEPSVNVELALPNDQSPACPFFLTRIIRGVKNGPSPAWLKHRLEAVGQTSINLLVDLSNSFMLEFNRPCHFFDLSAVQGPLKVRLSQDHEKFVALKGVEYVLPQNALVIEDQAGLLSLAGIKGAERGSIQEGTTDILIEIAHFSQDIIAATGRRLGLLSDARYRFERFVDPHQMQELMERLTAFVVRHAGGLASQVGISGTLPLKPSSIVFNPSLVLKLTGVSVEPARIVQILQNLGCIVEEAETHLEVTPPTWRSDVTLSQDLVEEVLRIVGYDALEVLSLPPSSQSIKGVEKMKFESLSRVRKGLTSKGYLETVTFSFMHTQKAKFFGVDIQTSDLLLKNPISTELDIMRPSILPNLLDAVSSNQARSFMRGAFFEIGPQYEDSQNSGQKTMISGLKYGLFQEKEWFGAPRVTDIYDLRSDLDFITQGAAFSILPGAPSWYHPGRSGTLQLGGKVLGYFGEVHPNILKTFGIKGTSVVAFEVFHAMMRLSKTKAVFERSMYQPTSRDLAFVVKKELPAEVLVNLIQDQKRREISSIKIFDVFEGTDLPDGHKSVAIRILFESLDHTFVEEEIETICSKLTTLVEQKTGGTLRR